MDILEFCDSQKCRLIHLYKSGGGQIDRFQVVESRIDEDVGGQMGQGVGGGGEVEVLDVRGVRKGRYGRAVGTFQGGTGQ